jgi:hypothetical protein
MIRWVALFVLSMLALGTWAQTSTPQHQHPNETVVEGAKNPELIPDSMAYRLWLVTVSLPPNATEKERTFQQAHLKKLQLTDADNLELLSVLTEFKSQYLGLIGRYNESAKAALRHGGQADEKSFLQQRDDLVSSTRDAIAQRLTHDGAARIEIHVKAIFSFTPREERGLEKTNYSLDDAVARRDRHCPRSMRYLFARICRVLVWVPR